MLTVRLLGQFSAEYRGVPLQLRARKAQALLAWLCLAPGTPHRREQFAAAFWPDAEREAGLGYVRRMLWQIRGAFEAAAANPDDYLLANDIDITFNPRASFWVDVQTLEQTANRRDASTVDMMQAARLYGDELLPGFDDEWIDEFRPRCQTQFDKLMAHLLPKLHGEGRWRDVVEFGRLWAAHGDALETAWQNVMIGFYGLGDLAGVRGAYKECRAAMRKAFDAEPSAETEALYQKLLAGAYRLAGVIPKERHATESEPHLTPLPPTNLPINLSPIVGREADVQRVLMELQPDDCRLLTLMGPGGIGKTRLAFEAALRQRVQHPDTVADGVFVARLEAVTTTDALIPAIADAVRLPSFGQESPRAQLHNFLREKRMWLVLDNFEQLLRDGVDGATVIADILANAPRVKILVTSRERLHLDPDEHLFELDGLVYPTRDDAGDLLHYSAVQLFVQAARRIYSRFDFEREKAGVARICRLTQGMPLALELAAAWVRALSCAEIAARIAQTIDALASERPELPERHRSVRAVLDYSWKLLSSSERNAFAALSVFRAGFQLEAAEDVARATVSMLYALVDKSLLRRTPAGRYEMHELVRQFGEEKLDAVEDEDWRDSTVHARMARYYLQFAKDHAKDYTALEPEWGNFLAALRAANERYEWPIVTELAQTLIEPWFTRARFTDAREGLALASAAAAADDDLRALANVMRWRGRACIEQGEYDEAKRLLEQGMSLSQEIADVACLAAAEFDLARISLELSDHGKAAALLDSSLKRYEQVGDGSGIGNVLFEQGRLKYRETDDVKALELLQKAFERLKAAGDHSSTLVSTLRYLALTQNVLGQTEEATQNCQTAYRLAKEAHDIGEEASALFAMSQIQRHAGNLPNAQEQAEQSLTLFKTMGDRKSQAILQLHSGYILYDLGEYSLALAKIAASKSLFELLGDRWMCVQVFMLWGDVMHRLNRRDEARDAWLAGVHVARQVGHPRLKDLKQRLRTDN